MSFSKQQLNRASTRKYEDPLYVKGRKDSLIRSALLVGSHWGFTRNGKQLVRVKMLTGTDKKNLGIPTCVINCDTPWRKYITQDRCVAVEKGYLISEVENLKIKISDLVKQLSKDVDNRDLHWTDHMYHNTQLPFEPLYDGIVFVDPWIEFRT